MKQFNKILVATDTRREDQTIVDAAAAFAKPYGASITIVDVVPDLGWHTIRALKDFERLRNFLLQVANEKLASLAEGIRRQGISVETRLFEGKTSINIVREIVRGEHDLLFAVGKGQDSRRRGFFGQTAKQLLRNCPCPLWLIPPGSQPKIEHILACVDTSSEDSIDTELNEKIYTLASAISEQRGAQLSLLHAWRMIDEPVLSARLKPQTVEELIEAERAYRNRLLNRFVKQFRPSIPDHCVHIIEEAPPDAVSEFVAERKVDLVVMGTVGRSGLSGLIIGNTAEKILEKIECSVLAVKPNSFKCPIT